MTTTDVSTTKKPGRRKETPAERTQRLARELKLAQQAEKDQRQRRLAAMGAALLVEATERPEFMATLRDILPRRAPSRAALTEIMALLDA